MTTAEQLALLRWIMATPAERRRLLARELRTLRQAVLRGDITVEQIQQWLTAHQIAEKN